MSSFNCAFLSGFPLPPVQLIPFSSLLLDLESDLSYNLLTGTLPSSLAVQSLENLYASSPSSPSSSLATSY